MKNLNYMNIAEESINKIKQGAFLTVKADNALTPIRQRFSQIRLHRQMASTGDQQVTCSARRINELLRVRN